MGIIVDLIIIAVLLLFIGMGYKKGLTGSLIKLLSFVIALVLAFMLYKPIASVIIEKTEIDENIKNTITNTLGQEDKSGKEEKSKDENTNTTILDNINNGIKDATEEVKNTAINGITETIIGMGSFITIYIVVRLVLLVVGLFVNQITKLPIIKQTDKIGGIVYGALEGIVIIYTILAIITLISIVWIDNPVVIAISKSTLGEMLYNHNFIVNSMFK